MTSECISGCELEVGSNSKIEAFDIAINACDRFEIAGLNEAETSFVLRDTSKSEGEHGVYVEVSIEEVEEKPLKSILDVIKNGRNDVVVKGYTRIVGYYSGLHNWNASKIGELKDRHEGNYGTPGYKAAHKQDAINAVNRLSAAYGT